MALTKKPVTGMKDIQPAEMQIREYVMNQIRETYKSFLGFPRSRLPVWSTSPISPANRAATTKS